MIKKVEERKECAETTQESPRQNQEAKSHDPTDIQSSGSSDRDDQVEDWKNK